jgi:hypothetical protein
VDVVVLEVGMVDEGRNMDGDDGGGSINTVVTMVAATVVKRLRVLELIVVVFANGAIVIVIV